MWLDKLTALDMTLMGRLGHKTNTDLFHLVKVLMELEAFFKNVWFDVLEVWFDAEQRNNLLLSMKPN